MQEISGYVDHIIYQNQDNGYTVFVLNPEGDIDEDALDGNGSLTCVGSLPGASPGEHLKLTGEYKSHKSYGLQFSVSAYELMVPQDAEAVLKYLSSGAIKGIGPALAKRIVDRFGDESFHIMETRPERLAEIRGISEKKAMEICDLVLERRDQRGTMLLLSSYGIGSTIAMRIYKLYGRDTADVIRENPYRLAYEVEGVGFKTVDAIASQNGFAMDSRFRIECGILYALNQMAQNGHTYMPKEMLSEHTAELLGVETFEIEDCIPDMVIEKKLVTRADKVYLPVYYKSETGTARLLRGLDEEYSVNESEIDHILDEAERELGGRLDEVQRRAVLDAASRGVFILTGGPGTGKTTTIRAMLKVFANEGMEIELCAPTGRAAKRMSEATGYPARTIHRLLGIGKSSDEDGTGIPQDNKASYIHNASHPLEADVIVVDEMSMVDILLMYSLVRAVPVGARLIMVGDANQLPSVGPGNVLRDMIGSGVFSVVTLERIFRQSEKSDIVENAHSINRGEHVAIDNKSRDFYFAKSYDADRIIERACSYLRPDGLPKYVSANVFDIQVLTPTRKGNLGVERLNGVLQQYLNPPSRGKKEYETSHRLFREGDKVMQVKNNYDIAWEIRGRYGIATDKGEGVFNGDIGIISEIDSFARVLTVIFDDNRTVEYDFNQLDELEHAFAMTIHKSQGSEYPAVIIPLLPGPRLLYNRNLLYTAITRAKKCVVIIGDETTFNGMIDNASENRRFSGLKEILSELDMR